MTALMPCRAREARKASRHRPGPLGSGRQGAIRAETRKGMDIWE